MGLINRLKSEVEHQERVLEQLQRGGLDDSDAARTARSNLRHYARELKQTEQQAQDSGM